MALAVVFLFAVARACEHSSGQLMERLVISPSETVVLAQSIFLSDGPVHCDPPVAQGSRRPSTGSIPIIIGITVCAGILTGMAAIYADWYFRRRVAPLARTAADDPLSIYSRAYPYRRRTLQPVQDDHLYATIASDAYLDIEPDTVYETPVPVGRADRPALSNPTYSTSAF